MALIEGKTGAWCVHRCLRFTLDTESKICLDVGNSSSYFLLVLVLPNGMLLSILILHMRGTKSPLRLGRERVGTDRVTMVA